MQRRTHTPDPSIGVEPISHRPQIGYVFDREAELMFSYDPKQDYIRNEDAAYAVIQTEGAAGQTHYGLWFLDFYGNPTNRRIAKIVFYNEFKDIAAIGRMLIEISI